MFSSQETSNISFGSDSPLRNLVSSDSVFHKESNKFKAFIVKHLSSYPFSMLHFYPSSHLFSFSWLLWHSDDRLWILVSLLFLLELNFLPSVLLVSMSYKLKLTSGFPSSIKSFKVISPILTIENQ